MIKAVIFDFFGVLENYGGINGELIGYIRAELKPKYKIGIISNTLGNWVNEMFSPQEVQLFDDIILSYKVGFAKPNPKVYELSLKNLGVAAQEAVFIDDQERYAEAARAVGMYGIFYENFLQMKTDLEKILRAGA